MAGEDKFLGLDMDNMLDIGSPAGGADDKTKKDDAGGLVMDDTLDVNTLLGMDTSKPDDKGERDDKEEIEDIDAGDEDKHEDDKEDKEGDELKVKAPLQKTKEPSEKKELPYHLVFKSLVEEGALTEFNEKEFSSDVEEYGPATAIVNTFRKEADQLRDALRDEYEEDMKEYAELKDLGIASTEAGKLVRNKMVYDEYKPEDLEGEDKEGLRKQILVQNFKNSSTLSDARITKMVDKIVDSGTDVEEAKEALDDIKKFNADQIKAAKQKKLDEAKNAEEGRKRIVTDYNKYIDGLDEILKEVKINKPTKEKIKSFIFRGGILEARKQDPMRFDSVVAYLLLNGVMDGNIGVASKVAKSGAIKDLENAVGGSGKKGSGAPDQTIKKEQAEEEDALISGMRRVRTAVSRF